MAQPSLVPPSLDHLVYATPNLESTVQDLREQLGVTPSPGGQHVGWGTRNYLLGLGDHSYLEIIGPDPEQTDFTGKRPFGLNTLEVPQLVAWAIRVTNIEAHVRQSRAAGYDPGAIQEMSRHTPDGERLCWKLTETESSLVPRLVPFIIDWGSTNHPSSTSSQGATLVDFHSVTQDAMGLQAKLAALGATCRVESGKSSRLVSQIEGRSGRAMLA
jgi:Glyoxalase-like domain